MSPKTRWLHLQCGMSTAINGIMLQKSQKYQTEALQHPVHWSKAIFKEANICHTEFQVNSILTSTEDTLSLLPTSKMAYLRT